MIIVTLKGADVYLSGEYERVVIPSLAKVYGVSEDDIIIHAQDGFLYHNGVEQTSYNLIVKVECDSKYASKEVECVDKIFAISKNFSIHTHVYFSYFDEKHMYSSLNRDYPRYLTSSNMVNIEEDDDKDDIEIYDGNIFKDFEDSFPNDEDDD